MKFLKIFLIIFILSSPLWFWWGIDIAHRNFEDYLCTQIQAVALIKIPVELELSPLELEVKAAMSVKINQIGNQKIIFEKKIDQPLVIASLTKLMTAVIVLEEQNYYDLKDLVIISEKAMNQPNVPVYGNLKIVGEKRSVKELLELMLIFSSNDAAFALSEVIGTENFVAKMNEKAETLGLENTYFINPTGLDPNLYFSPENIDYFNHSTVKELIKLAQYILNNHPLIFEISAQPSPFVLRYGIFGLFLRQEIIGGRTGFTYAAGNCLLFLFRDENDNIFINLILGAESRESRVIEMQKLLNWLNNFVIQEYQ